MKLRWTEFEKELRAGLKVHDARRRMIFWQRVVDLITFEWPPIIGWGAWLIRGSLTCLWLVIARVAHGLLISHPNAAIAGVSGWGLLIVVIHAACLQSLSRNDPEYQTLWMLPLTFREIFRREMRGIWFAQACLFIEFLAVYWILAPSNPHLIPGIAAAFFFAGLQAVFALALILLLVTRKVRPELLFAAPALSLFLVRSAWSFYWGGARIENAVNLSNPMGWLSTIYLRAWLHAELHVWWLVIPVGAMLGLLPYSLRAFYGMHRTGVFRRNYAAPLRSRILARSIPQLNELAQQITVDAAALRTRLLATQFLEPIPWNESGPIERLLALILRRNELSIIRSILFSPPLCLPKLLKLAACLAAIWITDTLLHFHSIDELELRRSWEPFRGWKIAMFLIYQLTLFVSAGTIFCGLVCWPSLKSFRVLLPIRAFEVWSAGCKVNALLLPLILLLSFLISWSPFGLPDPGSEGTTVPALARFVVFVGCFSFLGAWTSDIRRLWRLKRWQTKTLVFLALLLQVAWFTALGFGLLVDSSVASCLKFAVPSVAASVAWGCFCGWLEARAWKGKGGAHP